MFKQRKHRTFNYQPRFSKENQEVSNLENETSKDFISKWKEARASKRKVKGVLPIRTLILALVLLLILMYVLEKKYM
ncbi:hypothetical protein BWZ22_04335 [Seonamhaeicola sp. S2-3]|uniref:hypothetical protein n=1 Tax=Seonamhaeicola sp. S2-3 TaxID=1936081 RepID=UPI0009727727|nr:hypothetical protein [Seonamhaeicola sp. S2-3]APY10513.1 hypothetical protein BWZ22_04335 [Seonamhaeicola sp. S2-3]